MLSIGSDQWIDMLSEGAAQLGILLTEHQARLFACHAELLMEWNRRLNLTAIVDPTDVAVKHFLDAIAPLEHIPLNGRLLDIGTGGGFPGIPLKIMRPRQPMMLIDGVRKKISFVKYVIRQLALPSIEARQIRAEVLARDASTPKFDVIVCRALSDLKQVVQLAGPLLAPDGKIVVYRGPENSREGELEATLLPMPSKGDAYRAMSHAYHLPVLGAPRSVTVLTTGQ